MPNDKAHDVKVSRYVTTSLDGIVFPAIDTYIVPDIDAAARLINELDGNSMGEEYVRDSVTIDGEYHADGHLYSVDPAYQYTCHHKKAFTLSTRQQVTVLSDEPYKSVASGELVVFVRFEDGMETNWPVSCLEFVEREDVER